MYHKLSDLWRPGLASRSCKQTMGTIGLTASLALFIVSFIILIGFDGDECFCLDITIVLFMASICSGMWPESRKDHILQNMEIFMKTHNEKKSWEVRKWPFGGVEDSAFVFDTKHLFWKLSLCNGEGLFVDALPVQSKRKISHGAATPTPTPQCSSFYNKLELMCVMREQCLAFASYTASRDAGGERSPREIDVRKPGLMWPFCFLCHVTYIVTQHFWIFWSIK